jgi:hypothetical protein
VQQADINDRMRAILVDWLVEVHLKFKVTYIYFLLTCSPFLAPCDLHLI